MHMRVEIVMPRTEDIEGAVELAMAPGFEDWWDWYEIGGRWSGAKITDTLGKERIEAFYKLLHDRGVTVSGFQAGKHELSPPDQADMVDQLWVEHFPESGFYVCPLFKHAGPSLAGDIMLLSQLTDISGLYHVIVTDKNWEPVFDTREEYWDSAASQWVKSDWDNRLSSALAGYVAVTRVDPRQEDWMVVTVDYHN